MMFPVLKKFADENKYEMIFSAEQNHYPDVTFITTQKEKIALDLKSTYRKKMKMFQALHWEHLLVILEKEN